MFSPEKISQHVKNLYNKIDDLEVQINKIKIELTNFTQTIGQTSNEFICLKCGSNVEEIHEIMHNYTSLLAFLLQSTRVNSSTLSRNITVFLNKLDPDILKK